MKNKNILIVLIFILIGNETFPQSPDWLWSKSIGGIGDDEVSGISFDSFGNIFTTGLFYDSADFDPGNGMFNLTANSFFCSDVFISKWNSSGDFVWAKSIGGTGCDEGISIVNDVSGNVYAIGTFVNTVDLDPGPDSFKINASTSSDVFITKLDSMGNFIWAKDIGGFNGSVYVQSTAIDAAQNLYYTGWFDGKVDFDPSLDTFFLSAIGENIFIAKLDSSGNFMWAKYIGGTGLNRGYAITIGNSNGDIYTTGNFQDSVDFDPGPNSSMLYSFGLYDIFITKFDSSGNFIWAKQIGGMDVNNSSSIAVDESDNIYTTGYIVGTTDFDPGINSFNLTPSIGSPACFISKLDSAGNFNWAKLFGSPLSSLYGYSVSIGSYPREDVYVSGDFSGQVDFDPDTGIFNLNSNGSSDMFISKLDSSGNLLWAKSAGGTESEHNRSIALNSNGNIYAIGNYKSSTIDFGISVLPNVSGPSFSDVFIAKLDTAISTGIQVVNWDDEFDIYPNPASMYINIVKSDAIRDSELIIKDITGKIVFECIDCEQDITVPACNFSNGIYFVQLKNDVYTTTKKLIISK